MRAAVFSSFALSLTALCLTACAQAGGLPVSGGAVAEIDGFPKTTPIAASQICGGMVAPSPQSCSGANEYCHREIKDICGAADAPGTCRVKPELCTMDYAPVCGCDGKTYPNECAANSNGISAARHGECK